jgi:hypothetical protein
MPTMCLGASIVCPVPVYQHDALARPPPRCAAALCRRNLIVTRVPVWRTSRTSNQETDLIS